MSASSRLRLLLVAGPALLALLANPPIAGAQPSTDPVTRSRELFRAAAEARETGDLAGHLALLDEAVALRPGHPTLLYHRAGALCLNHRPSDALVDLELLAAMGLTLNPSEDPRFESLAEHPRFREVQIRFTENGTPRMLAQLAFRVTGPDLIPEGLAHDPRSGDFFLSSIRNRCILRVHEGQASVFSTPGDSLWSVMGLAVDAARNRLWVVTSALPQTANFDSADAGRAAVVAYDLDSGRRLMRVAPGDPEPHQFGDLALATDGTVFVSDGVAGSVLRLDPDTGLLTPLTPPGSFASPQGLVLSENDAELFVADYSHGIFRVDPATGDRHLLPAPRDALLMGIDGLARHGNTLIAIQNGISPHRVIRVDLDPEQERILALEVLETAHPEFQEPTLGVVVGDAFFFVANSQWNRFNPDASLQTDPPLEDPRVMRIPLFPVAGR